ncbi:MAG: DUF5985 family protein, partial [Betaproteobacteria bacterium]
MNPMLSAASATAYFVASIFFLRFWKSTGDRFFMFFTFSFLIEGVNRVVFYPAVGAIEQVPIYYMIRLVS